MADSDSVGTVFLLELQQIDGISISFEETFVLSIVFLFIVNLFFGFGAIILLTQEKLLLSILVFYAIYDLFSLLLFGIQLLARIHINVF